ncbi:hypothetical protein [Nocardia sp. NPDC024068]|uniref:hypothetical protein n=1 Tax=Nocardia sp. NPDC024068 TaxID=3157197 RepID=UPI0033E0A2BC
MTDEPLRVSLVELRRVFDVILEHLEAVTERDSVVVDEDYFWWVPSDAVYDVDNTPAELTIGSLADAGQQLRSLLADPGRVLAYDLVWFAQILRAIGEDIVR